MHTSVSYTWMIWNLIIILLLYNSYCNHSDTDDLDPNIDEEIMRGYEEFLQEFEDHLLLQEFGNRSKN